MSSKKRTVLNNVKIFDIANKGQAIAKFNERVILVDKGVPGDICDILVTKKRRKFWKGKIVKRIKDSDIELRQNVNILEFVVAVNGKI